MISCCKDLLSNSTCATTVRLFEWLGQAPAVRVFFPDAAECSIALQGEARYHLID